MLYTSKAIVLKKVKYSENSFIVHLFTEKHGHQTFIISRGHGKKKKASSLLFPLSLVEVNAYLNPKKTVQNIRTLNLEVPFQSIPFHPVKNAVAQFLSEVFFECIKNEIENRTLFEFLQTSIQILDILENNIGLFHIKNLLELTRPMGFYPNDNYSDQTPYFNLLSGSFSSLKNTESLSKSLSEQISSLQDISNLQEYTSNSIIDTAALLDAFMQYYEIHLNGFRKPKSLAVFRDLI